ncbi:fibronectin type III domain-containing protein [candidate division KSB1 bacterium]|nr:fibronectin type III domain-containing protein [candidate division KSB1 bacterium]RQW08265.1 MAG: fibronectin type III domain-containing protein [candidate division KSB1 bacterium]
MKVKIYASFILLFIVTWQLPAQIKSHEIGHLWETMCATGSIPEYAPLQDQMTYPGGDFRLQTYKNLAGLGLWIGVENWTDKFGTSHPSYVSQGGFENNEASDYTFPIISSGEAWNKKKVWERLPIVKVNGYQETRYLDTRNSSTKSATIPADEEIETKWATTVGVQVRMRSWALANQNHNSYIIREYTLTNDGNADGDENTIELPDQDLSGVYFGFQYYLIPGGDRGHEQIRQNDDWAAYYGNQPADTLRGLFYLFDGDADENHRPGDDAGDPDQFTGEFLSPQYPGFGVLHADFSHDDEADDRSQPGTVVIKPRKNFKSVTKGDGYNSLYAELSSGIQSRGTFGQADQAYDPTVQEPVGMLAFGPYDIPFGEDIRIVLYEVVGAISKNRAIQDGKAWKNGTLEFAGLTGDAAKNALLATGVDSLFAYAARAEYAWNLPNGLQDLPTPPPSPGLTIDSGPGKIELQWDSVADKPDKQTGELGDFSGYRIYRAVGSCLNVYEKIHEVTGDETTFTDRDVERGKHYYYYVTAFDDGSLNTTGIYPGQQLESSPYYNRNYDKGGVSPFVGARSDMDSIYVVPNPYHLQGLAFGGTMQDDYTDVPRPEDKLAFVGLPAHAKIYIFTMSGDLVTTLEHPNPENSNSIPESADESWYQISDSWMTIKSGVYVYYVEGWDLDHNPLGAASGKFVVIR